MQALGGMGGVDFAKMGIRKGVDLFAVVRILDDLHWCTGCIFTPLCDLT